VGGVANRVPGTASQGGLKHQFLQAGEPSQQRQNTEGAVNQILLLIYEGQSHNELFCRNYHQRTVMTMYTKVTEY